MKNVKKISLVLAAAFVCGAVNVFGQAQPTQQEQADNAASLASKNMADSKANAKAAKNDVSNAKTDYYDNNNTPAAKTDMSQAGTHAGQSVKSAAKATGNYASEANHSTQAAIEKKPTSDNK